MKCFIFIMFFFVRIQGCENTLKIMLHKTKHCWLMLSLISRKQTEKYNTNSKMEKDENAVCNFTNLFLKNKLFLCF